jgi:hypothetical protein
MACAVSFKASEGGDGEQVVISVNDTVIPSEVYNRSVVLRELVLTGIEPCSTTLPLQPEAFAAWAAFAEGKVTDVSIEELAVVVQVRACSRSVNL